MRWAWLLLLAGCVSPPPKVTLRTKEGVPLIVLDTKTGETEISPVFLHMLTRR